jgi:arylsulfatase A-like enzyme
MLRPRRRRLALAVLAIGLLAAVAWYRLAPRSRAVPPQIRLDEVADDLTASLDLATVREQAADRPVRIGGLAQRDDRPSAPGAFRRALIAPPPSTIHYRVRVPADGVLELEAGVATDEHVDRTTAAVAFRALIDGREVFARTVHPADGPGWHGRRVDLSFAAGREVELVLSTRAAGDGALAGTPGWGRVRLLRSTWRARQRPSRVERNVLVLLVDSLRVDPLGCYGSRPSHSPTLDGLAAAGTVFEQAIAQAPWTLPAVATLFTGLHPVSHGVVGGRWRWGEPDPALDASRTTLHDTIPTLAQLARRAGITTAYVTANGLVSPGTGLDRGFEERAQLTGRDSETRFARAAEVNARFLAWLAPNRAYRFLAYLHYMEPHTPYEPPAGFRPPDRADLPATLRAGDIEGFRRQRVTLDAPSLAYLRALYDGTVRYWDTELARLRAHLADLGVADSTVIVVLADHGEAFQEHGYLGHGVHLHDELLRVPLLVSGPGVPAARRPEQVQQIDFLPTVAALLGIDLPPGLPGHDLLGPPREKTAVASTAFWVAPDESRVDLHALRTPHWKLLHAPTTGHFELFDLVRDPAETVDRFGDTPEASALADRLAAWRATAPVPPPPDAAPHPDVAEQLRALGYVQ